MVSRGNSLDESGGLGGQEVGVLQYTGHVDSLEGLFQAVQVPLGSKKDIFIGWGWLFQCSRIFEPWEWKKVRSSSKYKRKKVVIVRSRRETLRSPGSGST